MAEERAEDPPRSEPVRVAALHHELVALRRAQERLRILLEASELLASSIDYETTLANLPRTLVPRLGSACVIDLVGRDGAIDRIAVTVADPAFAPVADRLRSLGPPRPRSREGILGMIDAGRAILTPIIEDAGLAVAARDEEHLAILHALELHSGLMVPMRARGRSVGLLWIYTMGTDTRVYDGEDLVLAEDLGRRAALAIDNARLHREAEDAIRARDVFLTVASHELKTPLAALALQVQGLYRKAQRAGAVSLAPEEAALADRQLRRLNRLIDTLLHVSEASSGRLALRCGPVDLGEVVADVAARMAGSCVAAGCEVRVEAAAPVRGVWDGVRLGQVVENLLGNALKYGRGAPVTLRVTGHDGEAEVSVEDRGIGIGAVDHGRIFEKYERAVSETNYGGLGMGLWIAQAIVMAHGGRIGVKSSPGQGATFTVTLPLPLASPEQRALQPAG